MNFETNISKCWIRKDKIDPHTQLLSFQIELKKILMKQLSKKNKEFNSLKKNMLSKRKNSRNLRKDQNKINWDLRKHWKRKN